MKSLQIGKNYRTNNGGIVKVDSVSMNSFGEVRAYLVVIIEHTLDPLIIGKKYIVDRDGLDFHNPFRSAPKTIVEEVELEYDFPEIKVVRKPEKGFSLYELCNFEDLP